MKIEIHSLVAGRQPGASEAVGGAGTARRFAPAEVEDRARLSLSQEAVNGLKAGVAQVPEVRRERVEALQKAVSDGSYQLSKEQVAEAVFTELLA